MANSDDVYGIACKLGIFNPRYFCENNGINDTRFAWQEYLKLSQEGYPDPSPLFNAKLFLNNLNIDSPKNVIELFLATDPKNRESNFCELFSPEWYKKRYMDSDDKTVPFFHYLKNGVKNNLSPSPVFDAEFYALNNPDVISSGIDPLSHYVLYGEKEERAPNEFFDVTYYKKNIGEEKGIYRTYLGNFYNKGILENVRCNTGIYIEPAYFNLMKPVFNSIQANDIDPVALGRIEKTQVCDYVASTYKIQSKYLTDFYFDTYETNSNLYPLIKSKLQRNINLYTPEEQKPTGFTIFTSYHTHFEYFKKCVKSVQSLMDKCSENNIQVEWLIANDDKVISKKKLSDILPNSTAIKIIDSSPGLGIVGQFNKLWVKAKYNWLVYLDCDDLIEKDAVNVLSRYINIMPTCRFISSTCNDIDEKDLFMRRRIRTHTAAALLRANYSSHLMAIRKDALEQYGGFNQAFDFIQDYEFALRLASNENILFIPEALYNYRWHKGTQSTRAVERNHKLDFNLKCHYIYERFEKKPSTDRYVKPNKIFFIIRTQGERLDLIVDSIRSIQLASKNFIGVVVGHGINNNNETLLKKHLNDEGCEFIYLSANDDHLARGYPLNVALKRIYAIADKSDLVAFLDDDDIIYPSFVDFIQISNESDIRLNKVNRRERDWSLVPHGELYPAFFLLEKNTIPINSFVVRVDFLRKNKISFREDLDYHEDWNFLIDCYMSNARIEYGSQIVAEYRMTGDGNSLVRKNPRSFEESLDLLRYLNKKHLIKLGSQKIIDDLYQYRRDSKSISKSMAHELSTFTNKIKL